MYLIKKVILGGLLLIFFIGIYGYLSLLSKNDFVTPNNNLASVLGTVRPNSDVSLIKNTESEKVYSIKYNSPVQTKCEDNKEYKPDFGDGTNTFGPFDFPVQVMFKGTVEDDFKFNGEIIQPVAKNSSNKNLCGNHIIDFTSEKIPAGKKITVSAVDRDGGGASIEGRLSITNDVLRESLADLQAKAKTDTKETGNLIVTFKNGMTKNYHDNPSVGSVLSGLWRNIFGSAISTISFDNWLTQAKNDVSKYGDILYITTMHNHPTPVALVCFEKRSCGNNGWPPSLPDVLSVSGILNKIFPKVGIKNYAVDSDKIWKYNFSLETDKGKQLAKEVLLYDKTGKIGSMVTKLNDADNKRFIDPANNTQHYINLVKNLLGAQIDIVTIDSQREILTQIPNPSSPRARLCPTTCQVPKPTTPTSTLTALCNQSTGNVYVGGNILYTAIVRGGTGGYTYKWNGTDDLSGTSRTVSKTYSNSIPTLKTATVTVTSGDHQTAKASCVSSVTEVPTSNPGPTEPPIVNPTPTPPSTTDLPVSKNFAVSCSSYCIPQGSQCYEGEVSFEAAPEGVDPSTVTYEWSEGGIPFGRNFHIGSKYGDTKFTTGGHHEITIKITSNGEMATSTCAADLPFTLVN